LHTGVVSPRLELVSRASSPLSGVFRLLAGCVAMLLALGDVLGSAHQAIEQHRICGEHGELVHGDAAADPGQAPGPAPTLRGGTPAGRDPAHRADEHCRLGATTCDPALLAVAVPYSGPVEPPPLLAIPALVVRPVVGRQVWRTAPKTSPPLA
jgi:hypothetical protein